MVGVELRVAVVVGVLVWVEVRVAVGVGVLVGVKAGVPVGVGVDVPLAGFNAISWARFDAIRLSSFPVPTVVSPVVVFKDWDISAVLPFPEAVLLRS